MVQLRKLVGRDLNPLLSGYSVRRIQKILNDIRTDSAKYVQIDRQRSAILTSIKNLEIKERAFTSERNDVKDDIAVCPEHSASTLHLNDTRCSFAETHKTAGRNR